MIEEVRKADTPPTVVQDYRSYTADEILNGILEFSESRGWTDPGTGIRDAIMDAVSARATGEPE